MSYRIAAVVVFACNSSSSTKAPPPPPTKPKVTGVKKPAPAVGKDPCTRENLEYGYSDECRDLGPWDSELAALGRGGARPCAVTVTKNDQPFYEARYSFDASGRTLEENATGTAAVDSYRRTWTYDADGRILTTTSTRLVNHSERYVYDATGRLASVDDGDVPLIFTRDASGAAISAIYKGSKNNTTITYTEDKVDLKNTSDGQTTTIEHDARGRRSRLSRRSGNWGAERTYGYDAAGRLSTVTYKEITEAVSPINGTITVRYDESGVPLEEVDVGGGTTYRYAYRYECP